MNVWTITDQGKVRPQNQDAYRVEELSDDRLLLMVCDGMGGARAGNVASELAARIFGDTVLEGLEDPSADPKALMMAAVKRADHAVTERAEDDPDCLGMGTTLVAALVMDGVCHMVNIGDSRAYLVSEEGIRQVTRDHSLVEDLVERGEITREQARFHPQKHLITRALGAGEEAEADLFEEPCVAGSFLLLCSDGLSNVVDDQELLYEIIHGGDVSDCCQRLLDTVLSRGAPDNMTAVLLQM